jgi:hypothetical protein
VGVATYEKWKAGEGFGEDVYKNVDGVTDTNGIVTFEGTSPRSNIKYGIHPKAGYYNAVGGNDFSFGPAIDGSWQPMNPTVTLVLRPVLNPVPMYAKRVDAHIKKPSQKYGFDLTVGDWVAPDGKGQIADLFFEVSGYWKTNNDYDSTLTISFANSMDGIQPFASIEGSEFLSPREALIDGYQDKLELHRIRKPGQISSDWVDDNQKRTNYFFRVRTVLDENGKIKSALYGKIYGGFRFGGAADNCFLIGDYYLNPVPNSLNMEFDPRHNLFKNLKPLESVSAP